MLRRHVIRAIASLETPEREAALRSNADRQALDAEQEAGFACPPPERERYAGAYVSVQDGQVADHDPNQRALYLRIRAQFGRRWVLIINADWDMPPAFTIHSPRLEQ